MTNGEKIAKAALSWLGTPHVNMAKSKGHGVDCGMLLIGSFSNEWALDRSDEWFLNYVKAKCDKVETMDTGDFLLYQYGRCISHGGIYIGDNILCHAMVDEGVILSELNDVMFLDAKGKSRLRGIYRFRG